MSIVYISGANDPPLTFTFPTAIAVVGLIILMSDRVPLAASPKSFALTKVVQPTPPLVEYISFMVPTIKIVSFA